MTERSGTLGLDATANCAMKEQKINPKGVFIPYDTKGELHNTIEFMGIWEEMYYPIFNFPEFEGIKKEAGLNRFVMSVKQWMSKTNAIGIVAKSGRYFM